MELALWKAKITEQSNGNLVDEQMKLQCRFYSLPMVAVVIPMLCPSFEAGRPLHLLFVDIVREE